MKVLTHTHIGERENNEDAFAYSKQAFVVCDGVGGQTKGEVASNFIANYIVEHLRDQKTETEIQELIFEAQQELNEQLVLEPKLDGMATTLTAFFKTNNGYYVSHIGDSRVYLVNQNQSAYWRTRDHSLVEDLLQAGGITEDAADHHPNKNMITRAILANSKKHTVDADIYHIQNLEARTVVLLCSDGVTEVLPDDELVNLLNSPFELEAKKDILANFSSSANDNNTFLLLEIEQEDEAEFEKPQQNVNWEPIEENFDDLDSDLVFDVDVQEDEVEPSYINPETNEISKTNVLRKVVPFLAIAALILFFILFKQFIKL